MAFSQFKCTVNIQLQGHRFYRHKGNNPSLKSAETTAQLYCKKAFPNSLSLHLHPTFSSSMHLYKNSTTKNFSLLTAAERLFRDKACRDKFHRQYKGRNQKIWQLWQRHLKSSAPSICTQFDKTNFTLKYVRLWANALSVTFKKESTKWLQFSWGDVSISSLAIWRYCIDAQSSRVECVSEDSVHKIPHSYDRLHISAKDIRKCATVAVLLLFGLYKIKQINQSANLTNKMRE